MVSPIFFILLPFFNFLSISAYDMFSALTIDYARSTYGLFVQPRLLAIVYNLISVLSVVCDRRTLIVRRL